MKIKKIRPLKKVGLPKALLFVSLAGGILIGTASAIFTEQKSDLEVGVAVGAVDLDIPKLSVKPVTEGPTTMQENKIPAGDTSGKTLLNIDPGDTNPIDIELANKGTKSLTVNSFVYLICDDEKMLDYFIMMMPDPDNLSGHRVNDASHPLNGYTAAKPGQETKFLLKGMKEREEISFLVQKGTYTIKKDGSSVKKPALCWTFNTNLSGGNNTGPAATETEKDNGVDVPSSRTLKLRLLTRVDMPPEYAEKSVMIHVFSNAVQYRNTGYSETRNMEGDKNFEAA